LPFFFAVVLSHSFVVIQGNTILLFRVFSVISVRTKSLPLAVVVIVVGKTTEKWHRSGTSSSFL